MPATVKGLLDVAWAEVKELAETHPDGYRLFRREDTTAWVVFTVVFLVLVVFDNAVLHRKAEKLSFRQACAYTVFWIMCAAGFCGYIYWERGMQDAANWMTGYFLEWMLSVDNLFVFHLIFQKFGTPDEQKHKPLFWGIVGAIVFRMIFFCIEEVLIHKVGWMHILFGLFLVYTGVKTVTADDEEEDPKSNPVFQWLSSRIPFVNSYDKQGGFFVQVGVDAKTGAIRRGSNLLEPEGEGDPAVAGYGAAGPPRCAQGSVHHDVEDQGQVEYRRRATLLLLVIVCLEVTDVIFAVDSVSAIVAQISDLYLAYTACVFAMLGLRATFFVIDELVKLFSLLKYGVALILVFIGVKLMLKGYVHFHPMLVCGILMTTMVISMAGSVVYERYVGDKEDKESD